MTNAQVTKRTELARRICATELRRLALRDPAVGEKWTSQHIIAQCQLSHNTSEASGTLDTVARQITHAEHGEQGRAQWGYSAPCLIEEPTWQRDPEGLSEAMAGDALDCGQRRKPPWSRVYQAGLPDR